MKRCDKGCVEFTFHLNVSICVLIIRTVNKLTVTQSETNVYLKKTKLCTLLVLFKMIIGRDNLK